MEPLFVVLVPGVLGGVILALLIALRPGRSSSTVVPRRLEAPSPTLINMAHIRVEGLGGLGMVAAVVAVAIADSRIRLAMAVAAVLGICLALALIAIRRRTGALPSAGNGPDDHSMLHLDARSGAAADKRSAVDEVGEDYRAGLVVHGPLAGGAFYTRTKRERSTKVQAPIPAPGR
jgi:hypothetical protein